VNLGLDGRLVFVAGSTRGIGRSIAAGFIAEGARVVVSGRDLTTSQQVAAELGGSTTAVGGDLTDEVSIGAVVSEVEESLGIPDVVVANVGSGALPRGWDLESRDWSAAFQMNLFGSMALLRAFLPAMVKRGSGSVIVIGSIAGLEAVPAPITYSAAKAALTAAAQSLSRQVGRVRVNVVAPGNVLFPGGSWERRQEEDPAGVRAYIQAEVPIGRFASPNEIADVVVFVASDRAAFLTGACLIVDGGQSHRFG
jgi:3-oxoacyl-[acyl-carrier protein] reductase